MRDFVRMLVVVSSRRRCGLNWYLGGVNLGMVSTFWAKDAVDGYGELWGVEEGCQIELITNILQEPLMEVLR